MRFEIPLSETQRYVLRTATGFTGLPSPFSQDDLKKNRDDRRDLTESEVPAWARKLREKRKELDRLVEQNLEDINQFYSARWELYEKCSNNRDRGEAALAFYNALSTEDREQRDTLFGENSWIFQEQENISLKEGSIYRKSSSKMLGILGIAIYVDNAPDYPGMEFYKRRIIPSENSQAVQSAVISGMFSKDLDDQAIHILKYIDSQALRVKGQRQRPTYAVVRAGLDLGISDIESVQKSFYDLSGLLCHLYVPKDYEEADRAGTIDNYHHRWFIPSARQRQIKEILQQ